MNAREKLFDSLQLLTKTMTIDDITVDMIVRKSGVSRTTFYRHFDSKYDLVIQFYLSLDKVSLDTEITSWLSILQLTTRFFSNNNSYLLNSLKDQGPNSFDDYFSGRVHNYFRSFYLRKKGDSRGSIAEEAALFVYAMGSISLIKEWMNGNRDYTEEETAEVIYLSCPTVLAEYLI